MRIAHLSDLHLRHHLRGSSALPQRLSRRVPELLAAAVHRMQAQRLDLLVLTGDVLDYPLELAGDDDTRVRGRRDLRLVADTLAQAEVPLVVIPGNHDHGQLVSDVFSHTMLDRAIAGHRVVCFCDREGDGHVPTRVGRERDRFVAVLAAKDSLPQVHVQHYLVYPERNETYPHTYARADELVDSIVGSGNVRLVLSGHYHEGACPHKIGPVTFSTVPAFCEYPHRYWVYDLAVGDSCIEVVVGG